jgi:hypothetical protein
MYPHGRILQVHQHGGIPLFTILKQFNPVFGAILFYVVSFIKTFVKQGVRAF